MKVESDKYKFTIQNSSTSTINIHQIVLNWPAGEQTKEIKIKEDGEADIKINVSESDGSLTRNLSVNINLPSAECATCQENDAAIGWGVRGHTWRELYHSDHVQIDFKDINGSTIFEGKFDYVEEDGTNACVKGGDGEVQADDAEDIISCNSSMGEHAQ